MYNKYSRLTEIHRQQPRRRAPPSRILLRCPPPNTHTPSACWIPATAMGEKSPWSRPSKLAKKQLSNGLLVCRTLEPSCIHEIWGLGQQGCKLYCQMMRSTQSIGGYPRGWFGGREWSRTKNANGYARDAHGTQWTRGFYWFWPPESKTLCPVLGGVVLLNGDVVAICRRSRIGPWWSARGGTPGRLILVGDLGLQVCFHPS
jgi:hypothetical protein